MDALWTYGFLQRALVAGVFIGQACAVLGVFLLLRKDAMIGHGLAHITFAGVSLAFLLHALPLPVAMIFSTVAALGILKLKESAGLHGDTAIAIVSSVGMALGLILATLAGNFSVAILNTLFGEILAIEPIEVILAIGAAALTLALLLWNYRPLVFATFDRESARVSGIRVSAARCARHRPDRGHDRPGDEGRGDPARHGAHRDPGRGRAPARFELPGGRGAGLRRVARRGRGRPYRRGRARPARGRRDRPGLVRPLRRRLPLAEGPRLSLTLSRTPSR